MTGLTSKFADFVVNISYKDLPAKAITAVKESIQDGMGCAFAGAVEPVSRIITHYVRDQGGNPQATVISGGHKTSAALAALANGATLHALDYDDAYVGVAWHPTSVLLPTVLALGEMHHASGKDLIQAYVAGLEVAVRLGQATHRRYYDGGWHNTGTIGSIGAAVSASKILKLNKQQTLMALGIAASEASGVKKNFGTMTKPFHAGNAAKNGVTAATLAGMGFSASEDIFEGPLNLTRTFDGSDEILAESAQTLGSSYNLISPGVLLKAYASCYDTHRCIEAALVLKKKVNIIAEDVVEVLLETRPGVSQRLPYHQPKTGLQGKFSLEYCVTIALLDGKAGLEQFTDEKVNDSKAQNLVQKVKYGAPIEPESKDAAPTEGVTIKLRGREYSQRVSTVKGHPQNPMTTEERFAKYRDCARLSLPEKQIEGSFALASNLENVKDISELVEAIIPHSG